MGSSLDVSGLPRLARPLRVLLVEDDANIREGLNKLVNTLGHRGTRHSKCAGSSRPRRF